MDFMELVLVSGLSGSGKSVFLAMLEDLDWYCLDNIPVRLLPTVLEELTGTTVSRAPRYQVAATSPQVSVIPPTTLGVLIVVQSSRPGSTRSGEKARKKSFPATKPF